MKKNIKGSSLVITLVLMALVSIMLIGAHTAVIALSTRINSTYFENQAYLSARSVVTAVAEEIANISQEEFESFETDDTLEVKTNNALIKKLNEMQDGDTITIDNFSFSNNLFFDGNISATIEKTTVAETTSYKILATADVNGQTETVGIELGTEEKTITRTEAGEGGVVENNSGTFSFFQADGHTYFNGDATFHNSTLKKEYKNSDMMVSTGNITLSGETKFEEEVKIYAKTITFDLREDTEALDLKAEFHAEEIKIYAKKQSDITDYLKFNDESKLYTNKVTVYINNQSPQIINKGNNVQNEQGNKKVLGVSSDYATIMSNATSKTASSGWPSDFPTTVAEESVSPYADKIEVIDMNTNLPNNYFQFASATNPKYAIVKSGYTFTAKQMESEYIYIYLEDGANLIINEPEITFNLFLGGDNCNVKWNLGSGATTELSNISGGSGSTGGSVSSTGITYNCLTLSGTENIVFYRYYTDLDNGSVRNPTQNNIYCWQGMHLAKTTGRYDNKNIYCKGEFLLTLGDSGSTISNTNIYADKIVIEYFDSNNNQNGKSFIFSNSNIYAKEIEIKSPKPINNNNWFQLNNSNIHTDKLTISITGENSTEYTAGQNFQANNTTYTVKSLPSDYQQKVGFPSESASWPSNYPTTVEELKSSSLPKASLTSTNPQDLNSNTIYYFESGSQYNFSNISATKDNPIYIIVKSDEFLNTAALHNEYCYIFLENGAKIDFANLNGEPKATIYSDPKSTVTIHTPQGNLSGTGESDGTGGGVVIPPVEVTKEYNYTTYKLSKYIRG